MVRGKTDGAWILTNIGQAQGSTPALTQNPFPGG